MTVLLSECTWHVALCFPTLDPLAALVPPVVLIGQNHVHVDVIVGGRFQDADVEAQKWEHPPALTHREREGKKHTTTGQISDY